MILYLLHLKIKSLIFGQRLLFSCNLRLNRSLRMPDAGTLLPPRLPAKAILRFHADFVNDIAPIGKGGISLLPRGNGFPFRPFASGGIFVSPLFLRKFLKTSLSTFPSDFPPLSEKSFSAEYFILPPVSTKIPSYEKVRRFFKKRKIEKSAFSVSIAFFQGLFI